MKIHSSLGCLAGRKSRCLSSSLFAALALALAPAGVAQVVLPPDPQLTCTLTPQQFASWFASGKVTLNGLVTPPNSVTFQHQNPCEFYQWSAQMFLWITSQTSASGGHVFDSPTFYGVSVADSSGNRTLIPNQPGTYRSLAVRNGQVGRNSKLLKVSGGTVTEVEQGQAGGNGVLMSQGKSLVYYTIDVNDVYAWLVTGTKNGGIQPTPTQFPTSGAQLLPIVTYAAKNGKILTDAQALTLELKTSWIDASTVSNPSQYITMTAEIPTYNTSSNTQWTPSGSKLVTLAMVGMHVVGSVNGHPEMSWATFEHINNAPNGAYSYVNNKGAIVQVPQNTAGNWLFSASNASGTFNTENMSVSGGNIVAATGQTIAPSNTLRVNPWGGASDAANNSQIIAINNAVMSMLPPGDVRRNYMLVGATWTNGIIPNSPGYQTIGSQTLANATMETYHQNLNCFVCHSGSPGDQPSISFAQDDLSHIFSAILALPTTPQPAATR